MWIVRLALRRPHVRRTRAADLHRGRSRCCAPHRHLPEHRHSGRQHRVVIQRLLRRRHGQAHHVELRTRAHVGRRRHRAHRIAIAERRVGREDLLPPGRRHQSRDRGSLEQRRVDPAHPAARHAAAEHHHVQRVDGADPAARAVEQLARRAAAVRPRQQLHPHAARDRPGARPCRCRSAARSARSSSISTRVRCRRRASRRSTW